MRVCISLLKVLCLLLHCSPYIVPMIGFVEIHDLLDVLIELLETGDEVVVFPIPLIGLTSIYKVILGVCSVRYVSDLVIKLWIVIIEWTTLTKAVTRLLNSLPWL